jgi:hypothetical protein
VLKKLAHLNTVEDQAKASTPKCQRPPDVTRQKQQDPAVKAQNTIKSINHTSTSGQMGASGRSQCLMCSLMVSWDIAELAQHTDGEVFTRAEQTNEQQTAQKTV